MMVGFSLNPAPSLIPNRGLASRSMRDVFSGLRFRSARSSLPLDHQRRFQSVIPDLALKGLNLVSGILISC